MSFLKDIEDALRLVARKPLLCVFCVDREIVGQHGLWHYSPSADIIIREYYMKKYGIDTCQHDKMAHESMEMSEFLATVICGFILCGEHLKKQDDELFIENCLRDRDVMIPLMRKNVQDHLNFDQSVFDEETANRLLQKYQRHEMYTKNLIDEFYGISEKS